MSNLPTTLILFAHPELRSSIANRSLLKIVKTLDNVTFRDLYAHYPDFFINVQREQQLLQMHDIIVFQFPLHTYGCPALMKEWIDRVLNLQFVGSVSENGLSGKQFRLVVTAGAAENNYRPGGMVGFSLHEILLPFRIMAQACGMEWIEPMVVYRARRQEASELQQFALQYAEWLSRPIVQGGNV